MSVTRKAKKLIFDIAKKNKAFRIVFRGSRDAAYRVKMTLDDPFGRIDDRLVYFQTFSGRGYSDSPKALYEYMMKAPEYKDFRFVWSFKELDNQLQDAQSSVSEKGPGVRSVLARHSAQEARI